MKKVILFVCVFICFLGVIGFAVKSTERSPSPSPSSWSDFERADGVSKRLQSAFSSFLNLFSPVEGTFLFDLTNSLQGWSRSVSGFYSDLSKPGFYSKFLGAAEFALVMPLKLIIWCLQALVFILNFFARVSIFVMGYSR